jgi:sugar phosphate isomerase/epimerase
MEIAYGTYAMPTTPLEKAIPLLAGMGYDGIEICVSPKHIASMPDAFDAARRSTIHGLLNEHGLGIPALFLTGHLLQDDAKGHTDNLEHVRRSLQLARDLGQEGTPVLSMGIGGKSAQWAHVKNQIVERLGDYADLGQKEGFILAGEAHCGAAVDRSERALWVINTVDSPHVRLHFDIVHFYLSGEDEAEAVQRLFPITAHTHITDARKHDDGSFNLLLLGDGNLDTVKYVQAMDEAGWNSYITLEVSAQIWTRDDYDPVQAAKQSYETLHNAFQKADIPRG